VRPHDLQPLSLTLTAACLLLLWAAVAYGLARQANAYAPTTHPMTLFAAAAVVCCMVSNVAHMSSWYTIAFVAVALIPEWVPRVWVLAFMIMGLTAPWALATVPWVPITQGVAVRRA
jgi:hypothetical protein